MLPVVAETNSPNRSVYFWCKVLWTCSGRSWTPLHHNSSWWTHPRRFPNGTWRLSSWLRRGLLRESWCRPKQCLRRLVRGWRRWRRGWWCWSYRRSHSCYTRSSMPRANPCSYGLPSGPRITSRDASFIPGIYHPAHHGYRFWSLKSQIYRSGFLGRRRQPRSEGSTRSWNVFSVAYSTIWCVPYWGIELVCRRVSKRVAYRGGCFLACWRR